MKERDLSRFKAAKKLHDAVVRTIQGVERTWVEVGKLCSRMRTTKLWQLLGRREGGPFTKFESWFEHAVGRRKSTIYVAMRAVEALGGTVSERDLKRMTLSNADRLAQVPPKKRKKLVKAAQTESESEFAQTVSGEAPEAHAEGSVRREFWLPQSVAEMVDRVIKLAKWVHKTDSTSTALEAIFSDYELGIGQRLQEEKHGEAKESETAPAA